MAGTSVRFPFRIVNGSVSMASDADAIRSKVMFCLGTQVNERVMRPSWGIDIMSTVYSVGADLEAAIPEAVSQAFRRWFPDIRLIETQVVQDPATPTMATVTVRFGDIEADGGEDVAQFDLPLDEGEI